MKTLYKITATTVLLLSTILGAHANDWLAIGEEAIIAEAEDEQNQIIRKGDKCFGYLDGAVYNLSPLYKKDGYKVKDKSGKYEVHFDVC